MKRDTGIDTLLNLDGFNHVYENAYWYKITAYRVEASEHIPHGIRYNLTFHDNYGTRIFAMDNAHVPPNRRRGFHGRIVEFDHSHENAEDTGTAYAFCSAEKLLTDFFSRVERILNSLED
ncbi:hypothetical protein MNBD_GAMMA11-2298 [hydrothermal vent metagenome]|uniref:Uncharacterized protein n=1 Tax=hydrothermal vent metagenome TaxID=652676 RepID=A0A3B0XEW6_9ZZZZ